MVRVLGSAITERSRQFLEEEPPVEDGNVRGRNPGQREARCGQQDWQGDQQVRALLLWLALIWLRRAPWAVLTHNSTFLRLLVTFKKFQFSVKNSEATVSQRPLWAPILQNQKCPKIRNIQPHLLKIYMRGFKGLYNRFHTLKKILHQLEKLEFLRSQKIAKKWLSEAPLGTPKS